MNAEFLHHLTLHFPIVLTLVWAVVGLWSLTDESETHRELLRWGGWLTAGLVTITVVSGILAAPGWFGGEGSEGLRDHRNLGLTSWVVIIIAAFGYELGVRLSQKALRIFAVGVWCVACFSVIGTGHWGGSELHPEPVPWLEEESSDERDDSDNRKPTDRETTGTDS